MTCLNVRSRFLAPTRRGFSIAALTRRNIPVEYLSFPDEGHGFLKRTNRRTAYKAVTAFLARHLLDTP